MPVLTIIRGLPGAGKSTLARQLDPVPYEADQFFMGNDGVYRYDHSRIADAHAWCLKRVQACLLNGMDAVVNNTFTRLWEMEPYVAFAQQHDFPIRFIEVHGPWKSVHGIPDDALERMRSRWEPLPNEWKEA